MADTSQGSMTDLAPVMATELKNRADQLAAILDIPPNTYEGGEPEACQVMGHVAAMPTVSDFGKRHVYGNEVLRNAAKAFPPSGPETGAFFQQVAGLVATMQELPGNYSYLSSDNEQLVETYVTVTRILDAMKWVGYTGFAGAGGKAMSGAGSGLTNALKQGATLGGAARGAFQGGAGAVGKIATGGYVSRSGIMLWVVGEGVYMSLAKEQTKMKQEITRRFQEGRLTAALYKRAFGSDTPIPSRYLFPVK